MDGPIVEFQIAIAETDIDKFIGTFMIMVKTSFHNAFHNCYVVLSGTRNQRPLVFSSKM